MADVLVAGPRLAGAGANIAGGSNNWTTPGNVTAADGNLASIPDVGADIATTNFGFALPTDRTVIVQGVVIELYAAQAVNVASRFVLGLTKDGATRVGTLRTATWFGLPTGWQGLGAQDDLFGTTLTVAEVNASTFGAWIDSQSFFGANTLDAVRMTVYYTQVEARFPAFSAGGEPDAVD